MIKRWIAAIALLCCASGLLYAQAYDPVRNFGIIPTRSVWSGVYSAAQASRGEYAYQDDECGVCHGDDLGGDSGAPALVGSDFMSDWDGQSILELVRHMHSMPMGDPDDIGLAEATDLTAYLLRENNVPPGSSDLPTDKRALAGIRVDADKPGVK